MLMKLYFPAFLACALKTVRLARFLSCLVWGSWPPVLMWKLYIHDQL